jgi:murein DD-endopeptidase MepM/ murein hydrolase activator NlpD
MDAIDIGASYNTPVISVKPGRVTVWKSGCADQPLAGRSGSWGCNGGWGNYIEITSPDGYVIRYAHLALQSMSLTFQGKQVNQRDTIARVDNNGNSTGSHLHFEVVSGPEDIFSIVPLTQEQANAVNHCVNSSGNGCGAACPAIRTSIN